MIGRESSFNLWPGPGALRNELDIHSRRITCIREGALLNFTMSGADKDMKCYSIDNTHTIKS